MTILTVHVVEVGMVAPDIVCMIVRDQEPELGHLKELATPDSGAYGAIVQRDPVTGGAGTDYAHVTGQINGQQKRLLKFSSKKATAFLDRAAIRNVSNWATIGGRTVTSVHHKSRSWGQYTSYSPLQYNGTCMEHYIYLKLNGVLTQGTHTISITGNTFPPYSFVWNDRTSRSTAIHSIQTGYRAAEQVKVALVSCWIPGYGTEGVIDYGAYTTAELIDVNGVTVHTGPLTRTLTAAQIDPEDSYGASNYDYASTTIPPKVATAVVAGTGVTTFTVTGHGFSSGQKKYLQGFARDTAGSSMRAGGSIMEGKHTITVTGANTFTIPVQATDTWVQGGFRAGYDSLVFETRSSNRWGTNLYTFDFASFSAINYQGKYRVRIPGIGVSDAFDLTENTRHAQSKILMQGYYNQLQGMALDPAVGLWDRGVSFRDGSNGVQVYESRCPGSLNSEAFANQGSPHVMSGFGGSCNISFSADLITGNVFNVNVNGVAIAPVTFTTSHTNTMNLIVAAVQVALPGVFGIQHVTNSKSVTFYHTIGNGNSPSNPVINFTGAAVTGGATQPAICISPFITNVRVTHPFVSIRDAGDWDYHECMVGAKNEGIIPYYLLEWGYRWLPAGKRDVSFGFPKASALNASLYAGTDGLGDSFHMAVYQIEAFRATQKSDGRVYGGMNYQMVSVNGDKGGGYDFFAPSQHSINNGFLLAASPPDNVVYATSAAKLAQVLREGGFTAAANTWQISAEKAWDWAEALCLDFRANGRTGTVVDGYFNGTLGFQAIGVASTGQFFSDNSVWNAALVNMFGSTYDQVRWMAAGALYNLTNNDAKYGVIIAPRYTTGAAPNAEGIGLWEFCNCADAKSRYPSSVAYLNARWGNANVTKNSNFDIVVKPAIQGPQDQTNIYMQMMLQNLNYAIGVNQEDRTFISAMGIRPPQNASIRDREAMGLTSEVVPGTRLMAHFAGQHAYGGPVNYSSDSTANFTVVAPMTGAGADPLWESKVITPFPTAHPYEESFNDNTYAAYHTEYICIDSATTFYCMAFMAHCFDGNDVTSAPLGRYKRTLACAA